MGVLDEMREIGDLIKKAGDIELYRRIVKLEGEVTDLTRENRQLEEKVEALERTLKLREDLCFVEPFYWLKGDGTPFCPSCWETKREAVHVTFGHDSDRRDYSAWERPSCKHHYYPKVVRQLLASLALSRVGV